MRPILLVFGLMLAGMVEGGRRGPPKVPIPAPPPADNSREDNNSAVSPSRTPHVVVGAPRGSEDVLKPLT
jgi:hypothetical protein